MPYSTFPTGACVEEGTGMDDGDLLNPATPDLDIKFHSDMTYAEKLMLKRARRTQLGSTPSRGSASDSCVASETRSSRGEDNISPRPFVMSFSEVEVMDKGAYAMGKED